MNLTLPFLWYQKLDSLCRKYMFVIEKYGYITDDEEKNLKNDLIEQGFKIQNIEILAPKESVEYGQMINFEVKYKINSRNVSVLNGVFGTNENNMVINVKKTSFCKR
ncbi:MAG: hypothetical protein RSB67_00455 [Clostridia bacterium]